MGDAGSNRSTIILAGGVLLVIVVAAFLLLGQGRGDTADGRRVEVSVGGKWISGSTFGVFDKLAGNRRVAFIDGETPAHEIFAKLQRNATYECVDRGGQRVSDCRLTKDPPASTVTHPLGIVTIPPTAAPSQTPTGTTSQPPGEGVSAGQTVTFVVGAQAGTAQNGTGNRALQSTDGREFVLVDAPGEADSSWAELVPGSSATCTVVGQGRYAAITVRDCAKQP